MIEALWVFLIAPQLFCKGWFSLHLFPTMATSWCSSGFSYKVALILGAWLEAEVFVAPSIVWFLPLITPFPKPVVELFSWLWSPLRGCHQRMVFSARLFLFCGLARALSHPYPPPFIAPAKLTRNVLEIMKRWDTTSNISVAIQQCNAACVTEIAKNIRKVLEGLIWLNFKVLRVKKTLMDYCEHQARSCKHFPAHLP